MSFHLIFAYLQDTVLELEFQGVKKSFTMLQVCNFVLIIPIPESDSMITQLQISKFLFCVLTICRLGLYVPQGLFHQSLLLILHCLQDR